MSRKLARQRIMDKDTEAYIFVAYKLVIRMAKGKRQESMGEIIKELICKSLDTQ